MRSTPSIAFTLALLLFSSSAPALEKTPAEKAWEILEAGLKEKGTDKCAEVVRALGIISRDPKALELARNALKDTRPDIRRSAATALGQIGLPEAIPDLKGVISDKDPSVVLAAAHSLHLLNDPSAYEVYYAVLTGQRKSGQGMVAEGMETLKDKKKMAEFGVEEGLGFIPFAGFGYSAVKALRKDDVSPVRAGAAATLATDPDPRTGEALVKATSDKSWIVRAAALDALAKRGDPKLLEGILPALDDRRDLVRYTAAATVIRLGSIGQSSKRPTPTPAKPKQKKKV
jgi:HEAT repeat protein